jgi:hypothetical protein
MLEGCFSFLRPNINPPPTNTHGASHLGVGWGLGVRTTKEEEEEEEAHTPRSPVPNKLPIPCLQEDLIVYFSLLHVSLSVFGYV